MSIIGEMWEEDYFDLEKKYLGEKRKNVKLRNENTFLKNANKSLEEEVRNYTKLLQSMRFPTIWHNLTENPADLPKIDCKNYLAYALDDEEPAIFHYIASKNGQWELMPNRIAYFTNDQIKRWCELPT